LGRPKNQTSSDLSGLPPAIPEGGGCRQARHQLAADVLILGRPKNQTSSDLSGLPPAIPEGGGYRQARHQLAADVLILGRPKDQTSLTYGLPKIKMPRQGGAP